MQKYAGTWVCLCRNAELHEQSGRAIVIAGSETDAKILVCEAGAAELFAGNREMRQHFRAEGVCVLERPATQIVAPA